MHDYIMQHEAIIRISCFMAVLVTMAGLELLRPRRELIVSKAQRWVSNLGIVVINTLVIRLLFPTAAVGVALVAENRGWGLFNVVEISYPFSVVVSVFALDLLIYGQHVLMHKVPVLWRLHRVHHVDLDFDVTTGARFHPIEIVLSMLIKFAAIVLLGAPVFAVLIFEVILSTTSMFNHSNVRLPLGLDKYLRLLLVTPDMHRVHHSVIRTETDSNFGFNVPWWDWIFGTYRDQPQEGHQGMTIGLTDIRDPALCVNLAGMLKLPFVGKAPLG